MNEDKCIKNTHFINSNSRFKSEFKLSFHLFKDRKGKINERPYFAFLFFEAENCKKQMTVVGGQEKKCKNIIVLYFHSNK